MRASPSPAPDPQTQADSQAETDGQAQQENQRFGPTEEDLAQAEARAPEEPREQPREAPEPELEPERTETAQADPAEQTPPASPPQVAPAPTEIHYDKVLSVQASGNPPRYSQKMIRVKAGQVIALDFKNSTTGDQVLNWVLVEKDKANEVRVHGKDAGIEPGDVEYEPAVLAATRNIGPGETASISFIAPDSPGSYTFLCSVGSFCESMRGTLIVEGVS